MGITSLSQLNATNPGLRLITPTSIASSGGSSSASGGEVTFTGVSSISLNGVFSSTYDTYLLQYDQTAISGGGVYLNYRMRLSGTDATGSDYEYAYMEGYSSGATGGSSTSQSNGRFSFISSTNDASCMATLFAPAIARYTKSVSDGFRDNGNPSRLSFGCRHNVATAYDGITVYPDAGSATGKIRIYGIQNS